MGWVLAAEQCSWQATDQLPYRFGGSWRCRRCFTDAKDDAQQDQQLSKATIPLPLSARGERLFSISTATSLGAPEPVVERGVRALVLLAEDEVHKVLKWENKNCRGQGSGRHGPAHEAGLAILAEDEAQPN